MTNENLLLIADDHQVFRMGLRSLAKDRFAQIEEARDGFEAVEMALAHRPVVIAMDLSMPGKSGIEAAREIRKQMPDVGIVVFSATDADQDLFDAIQAGVNSFVLKDDDPSNMLQALENAAAGKAYLPPLIAKRVLDGVAGLSREQESPGRQDTVLSSRQLAVLRLMAMGKRNREIALELNISERTVGNHMSAMYDKLCITDRAQAIVYAIKHGIVRG